METNTNKYSTLILILVLLLGIFTGYYFGNNKQSSLGVHTMPDGTVMGNQAMDMTQMMADMNASLVGKVGDDFDRAFLSEMIVHHEGAVQMAKLAQTSSKHQEIKDLADGIISAQNKEIGDMKGWLKSWYGLGN